jgi:AcrR family transcriptional regulator
VTNVKDELKRLATEQTQRGGVRSVTLRDLGRAVGIKSPSVLYHFKNKDTLVFEITLDHVRRVQQSLSEIERCHTSAKKRLLAAVDMFLKSRSSMSSVCARCSPQKRTRSTSAPRTCCVTSLPTSRPGLRKSCALTKANTLTPGQASARSQLILTALEGAMLLDKADGEPKRLPALRTTLGRLIG